MNVSAGRDPRYNATLNPRYNVSINPRYNVSINPRYNTTINPSYNTAINPRYNTAINPQYNTSINFRYNTSINPAYNHSINPIYNTSLNPRYSADINGQYVHLWNQHPVVGIIVSTPASVWNVYNKNLQFSSFGVVSQGGVVVNFDLSMQWIGIWVPTSNGTFIMYDTALNIQGYTT